jgi:Cu(I)/Ag(I) efflux system membrane fusion protein
VRKTLRFVLELVFVRLRFVAILVVTGLVVGYWDTLATVWRTRTQGPVAVAIAGPTEFYCPMHPTVVRDSAGACPICGMPLSQRRREDGVAALPSGVVARAQLSPFRIAQAGIATSTIRREALEATVEAVGTIDVDERRLARISARVAGRVDKLFVDFTGTHVRKGEPLVWIYSPNLSSSIDELLVARRSHDAPLERAARERLILWGMSEEQVERILAQGKSETHVEVLSPQDGTVLAKPVVSGQYVSEGTELYEVADLSVVWLNARVFEGESALVRVGLPVSIVARALPGERLEGYVAFVDPLVDPATRTVRVRIDIPNHRGGLKPGGYAQAVIRVPLGTVEAVNETAASPEPPAPGPRYFGCCEACPEIVSTVGGTCPKCGMMLEERQAPNGARLVYSCPMHPEIEGPAHGTCPSCGMKLLLRLELPKAAPRPDRWGCLEGHPPVFATGPGTCPLCARAFVPLALEKLVAVPVGAVIDTGSRRVVYRESSPGVFDAAEVELGPRAGEYYPVLRGLVEGDRVATEGAFLIDAETRLNPGAASAFFGATGRPR